MAEFWENAFKDKNEMWGTVPAQASLQVAELFHELGFRNILIPGIGYGRNARPFLNLEMQVSGIEISKTAIALAQKHFGEALHIHYGSVTDMPFDKNLFEGIFCHALIHLLDQSERHKLIKACFDQLSENGILVFTAITKEAQTFGQGTCIGKDRYEQFQGVKMFFYDIETIREEFESFGLYDITEINENYPFYLIKCRKKHVAPE